MDHFNQSKHTYAMEIDTQNVWDFSKVSSTFSMVTEVFLAKLRASIDPKPDRWKAH
jgi:hypothetical protein